MAEDKFSIKGKIIAVLPERKGTSQKGEYYIQEYVVEEEKGQYPMRLCFEVFGRENIDRFNIKEGDTVEVFYNFNAREWNGKWFNSIRAWRVSKPYAEKEEVPDVIPSSKPKEEKQPEAPKQAPANDVKPMDVDQLPF